MRSLLTETRLLLSALARSQNVNTATVWRWGTKGVRGVKLETIVIGGRRVTTQEAFERFVAATNPEATATPPAPTPHERRKAIAAAERELAKAGI